MAEITGLLSIPVFHFRRLASELPQFTYRFATERDLHDGLAQVLDRMSIAYERESTDGTDRFDFLCAGGIVLEAKINGSFMPALRQAECYCRSDSVSGVIIVAARNWATSMHGELKFSGKPVRVVRIMGAAF